MTALDSNRMCGTQVVEEKIHIDCPRYRMFCSWWFASTSAPSPFTKTMSSPVTVVESRAEDLASWNGTETTWRNYTRTGVSRSRSTGVCRNCKLVRPQRGSCQPSLTTKRKGWATANCRHPARSTHLEMHIRSQFCTATTHLAS